MSKEELHALIDKLSNIKYTGLVSLTFVGGGVADVEHTERGIRFSSQMVLMVGESKC